MNIPLPRRYAWLLAALALALPVHLPAQALDEALKNFKAAPVITSASSEVGYAGNVLREWDNSQNQLSSLDSYIDNNDFTNALNQARQYARNARTPEVRKLWDNLVAALQSEAKARETAFNQKVDEVCTRSGKLAVAATKSADLDGVIDELYSLQEARNGNYNNRQQRTYSRIDNTVNFLNGWQDYLGQLEAGDIDSARSSLRNLNSNSYRYRPVSRSEVIKLIGNLKTSPIAGQDNLLDDATLDNLATIRTRVAAAQENTTNRRSNEFYAVLGELDAISRAVGELKVNRPVSPRELLRNSNSAASAYQDAILKLKDAYIIRALPALSGIPRLDQPKPGETALVYVYRLVDESVTAEDWPRAQRLATVAQDLVPNTNSCSVREPLVGSNPAAAIKAWMNAQRMDKAAQPYAAADFYRQALAAGAPVKLEDKISARLRELAVEFPESTKLAR
ncbi:MAG: hypothetical protein WC661_12150 [Opitutaceae bacterium]|jgi:hypothetical protein